MCKIISLARVQRETKNFDDILEICIFVSDCVLPFLIMPALIFAVWNRDDLDGPGRSRGLRDLDVNICRIVCSSQK